ncbi:MAG TPA: SURF1 family protein [Beijerinckiaceae bacterium]|jgi:surfeit locus 1 family protein
MTELRRAGLLWPGLATLVALAILIGLGSWQLQRKAWKENLIAQVDARAHGAPQPLPPEARWPDWKAEDEEFRRVTAQGRLEPDKTVLLNGILPGATRGMPLQGYYVFAPLRLEDGGTVMINRGFIPSELKDQPGTPWRGEAGPTTLNGLLRAPERRSLFVPENDPARETWFVRDVGEMARARGLDRVAPFYVEVENTPGAPPWPKPGQAFVDLPNNHLQYALTWFGIAATLLGVFGVFARQRLR